MKGEKCAYCRNTCDLEKSLYKIKHGGKIYCFCSGKCKNEFQKKKFGEIIY